MRKFAVTSRPATAWKVPVRAMAAAVSMAVALPGPAAWPAERVSTVRDAETEALLADYLAPILKAAGQPRPKVLLVPSQAFNAFVTTERRLFVNVGTIIASETPNELIGVLAHEIAHVAHNDVTRTMQAIEDTKAAILLATLVGVGAAATGAATGADGMGKAGAGVVSGGIGIAERSLLRYKREQEAAADRAAVGYLDRSGQSATGMLATLQRLASDNLFASRQANPYLQSHPLPGERVNTMEGLIAKSKFPGRADPPALQQRHDLVRAKLVGFTWTTDRVMRRYPISDNSLSARYARAIAYYRSARTGPALEQIDGLIKSSPGDPYFWELKGQALLETGRAAAAIDPLRKAVSLAPRSVLLKILLGQALVAVGGKGNAAEAVKLLAAALVTYPDLPLGYRALARAYAIQDNVAMAQLTTAQGLFIEGSIKEAQMQATRAQAKLKAGTPAWLRADDIVSYKPAK